MVAALAGFLSGSVIVYDHVLGFDPTASATGMKSTPGMTGIVYPTLVAGEAWPPAVALLIPIHAAALCPAWRAPRSGAGDAPDLIA